MDSSHGFLYLFIIFTIPKNKKEYEDKKTDNRCQTICQQYWKKNVKYIFKLYMYLTKKVHLVIIYS